MSVSDFLVSLKQLTRMRPLLAWAGGGILLGIATAVNNVGFNQISWELTAIAVLIPLLLQYLAHPLNDLIDFDVDLRAPIKATGRKKVLVSGLMTHKTAWILCSTLLLIILGLGMVLIIQRPISGFFLAIGLYAVLGYNVLKLGWKPFSEFTIVMPTLITLVVAVSYVASGEITWLAIIIGILHAIVGVQFFMTSRAMDTEADYNMGKITTLVKFPSIWTLSIYSVGGLPVVLIIGMFNIDVQMYCIISIIALIFCSISEPDLQVKWIDNLKRILYGDPGEISRARNIQIYTTIVNAIVISTALVLT